MSSPVLDAHNSHFMIDPPDEHDDTHKVFDSDHSDGDTASQRSISLSSPSSSRPTSTHLDAPLVAHKTEAVITPVSLIRQGLSITNRDSITHAVDTDGSSDHDTDDRSSFMRRLEETESPSSSLAASIHEFEDKNEEKTVVAPGRAFEGTKTVELSSGEKGERTPATPSTARYPPPPVQKADSRASLASFGSGSTSYSKKARPESVLIDHDGPIVLGIALVDFNHLVGPKIEWSRGDVFGDEETSKILPFLALPDGAHLTVEDYSYFHLVPVSSKPTTIFGISCNRQIRTADLLVKDADMTRSTVQKAVIVLASKPVFGPIRDRLGVVTRALFAQRDFTDMSILDDFHSSLDIGLRSQLTESGLYMGTSLRELVHTFRQRTLILLKAMMLQKKIMFYGHPVEKLCTYQYSLVTLVPGLLQNLDDCGSPPLATRAARLSRPTELKTSDPKSMLAYMGLPLDLFGQASHMKALSSDTCLTRVGWLCGTTNSIVTQQKEIDLLINVETGVFEFRDPTVERSAGLTAADRKWMDDIVKDVNDNWEGDLLGSPTIQFKGSDDYLRQKYGIALLIRFFSTSLSQDRPSVVADIGLRLAEGINDLKIDQQLDLTKDAIQRTFTAGSTNFFKAVEGVRGRWMQRASSSPNMESSSSGYLSSPDTSSVKSGRSGAPGSSQPPSIAGTPDVSPIPPPALPNGMRPFSLAGRSSPQLPVPAPTPEVKPSISTWGSGLGSFFTQRAPRFSAVRSQAAAGSSTLPRAASPAPSLASTRSQLESVATPVDHGLEELQPRNLDEIYGRSVPVKISEVSGVGADVSPSIVLQGHAVEDTESAGNGFAL
ncbi:transport protein Avl9-domain-containing protein [Cytidiella melzeri]|nr:transport protein Avl9-domain-containing protein [Cytidiella melzeri]